MSALRTFTDDALGVHDAVGLAAEIAAGRVHPAEAVAAAFARSARAHALNAVVLEDPDRAFRAAHQPLTGPLAGVPTYIKDNVHVAGWPTRFGSDAVPVRVAKQDDAFVRTVRESGMVLLGKSTLPEFGFSSTTEWMRHAPTHNPWDLDRSTGGSSGGAAALVAAGVVPVAHAKDGGGSIRIPAAACGLVGLKYTRGRDPRDVEAKALPINILTNGILSRSVRDTAVFAESIDAARANPRLPRIGTVRGPGHRRTIGIVRDSPFATTDAETRAAVDAVAAQLSDAGHHVTEIAVPVDEAFADAFLLYWGLAAYLATRLGRAAFGAGFDPSRCENLTHGLADHLRRNRRQVPRALRELRQSTARYRRTFEDVDLVLSPVVAHTTPKLGHLDPNLDYDTLMARLLAYVAFTPANNATGGPAMSLPLGTTSTGMPIGVHFSADIGDERALLEIAFELEEAIGFPNLIA